MGHEAFIDWIAPEIAVAYFIATTVALVGILQVAGVAWGRPELRLLPTRGASLALGTLLALGALAGFYLTMQRLILVPGLAGTELIILFTGAALLARLVTAVVARARGARPADEAAATATLRSPAPATDGEPRPAAPPSSERPAPLPADAAWHHASPPPPADAAWVAPATDTHVPAPTNEETSR